MKRGSILGIARRFADDARWHGEFIDAGNPGFEHVACAAVRTGRFVTGAHFAAGIDEFGIAK